MRPAFRVRSLLLTKPPRSCGVCSETRRALSTRPTAPSRWPVDRAAIPQRWGVGVIQSCRQPFPLARKYSTKPDEPDDVPLEKSTASAEEVTHKSENASRMPSPPESASMEERLENLRQEGMTQAVQASTPHPILRPSALESKPSAAPQGRTPHSPGLEPFTSFPRPSKTSSTTSDNVIDDTTLPSQTASNRSAVVARFHTRMERLLSSLAIASQRVNTYTGTDYSGIASLRDTIIQLERLMKEQRALVVQAKEAQSSAMTSQSASQKEVVQLLERKHSWSAADLERYMTLIRSEHLNEQAVQAAKEGVAGAERSLEDARARLEKFERRQYHEEQIWSDTIRRNSTWVTFGLMGFNIFLLLASLVLIEPWRRRRLVKEVKSALDERRGGVVGAAAASQALDLAPTSVTLAAKAPNEIKEEVDAATVSASENLEQNQKATVVPLGEVATEHPTRELMVDIAQPIPPVSETAIARGTSGTKSGADYTFLPPKFTFFEGSWTATFQLWKAYWADLFSERRVAMRKVDLTAAALEGAAAGAACMGLLFVMLRPR